MTLETSQHLRVIIDALNDQAYDVVLHDLNHARTLSDEALAVGVSLNPRYDLGYARALTFQVGWHVHQGHFAETIQLATEIQAIYEHYPPDRWLCHLDYWVGIAYCNAGQYALALESHQEQLAIARQLDLGELEAAALRRIGVVHGLQNQYELAMDYYDRSLAVYEHIGWLNGAAGVYNNRALILRRQGRIKEAIDAAQESLRMFTAAERISGQIHAHTTLVEIYISAHQLDQAAYHADAALALSQQGQGPDRVVYALTAKAEVLLQSGQATDALVILQEASARAEASHHLNALTECLRVTSSAHAQLGDYQQALAVYQRYHALQSESLRAASAMQYEHLEVLHQTRQAQAEAETQRRLREEDRRYYEQLAHMKDELLSTASHDLKNPLASIIMQVYLVRALLDESQPKVAHALAIIEKNVEQMRALVVNLLDLARLESAPTLETVYADIVALARQVTEEFQEQATHKGLALHFETALVTQVVKFDPKRIHQVLTNLISNALKYTQSGAVRVELHEACGHVAVRVVDSGVGIPADDLPHIFDRFYRVRDPRHAEVEGTGLGLAICRSIVEQHHGRIWVESTVGRGTVFAFELPLRAAQTGRLVGAD